VRVRECASTEATAAGQDGGDATVNGEKQANDCERRRAHGVVGRGTCKKISQHGTMAVLTRR
jgi:hypothetical protein